MSASKPCWLLLSALGLALWPVVVTAHGDLQVGRVQEQLQKAGLNPGPIDGVLGPRTKAMLRRYQASHGLPATGLLDEATRQALLPSGHDQGTEETKAALRRYQASHGLPATGLLDEATRQALLSSGHGQGTEEGPREPWLQAPPGGEFRKVSSLVPLPEFFPGLGVLYVQPHTLPVGPFLAYDRQGTLVSTIYMFTLRDLGARKSFDELAVAHAKVDHVDVYPNDGHPGVPTPHYHVILWYIPEEQVQALK
jgi:hypothetical protein